MTTSTGSIPPPNPLSYTGDVVVPYINKTFDPQSTFNTFSVPTVWINTASSDAWILTSKAGGVATWVPIGGIPGQVETITTPDSTVVVPTDNNINFLNGSGVSITGSGSNITFAASGSVAILITADSGTATPSSGNLNVLGGSTGITTSASGSTVSLDGTLNVAHGGTSSTSFNTYGPVVAGATNTAALTSVSPSATSGIPLISQGSSANPAFGTAVVAGGGTGATSFTAYSVICGGTTSTGSLQNVSGVGTSGQILTSNGAGALPTWQNGGLSSLQINMQIFTASGTYTPTAGLVYCIVEIVGGGGGGGGLPSVATYSNAGGGGGAGAYVRAVFSAADIGVSQSVTIGAGGAGGVSTTGSDGGSSTFGALLTAGGGFGGPTTGSAATVGGAGGTGSATATNYIVFDGGYGGTGTAIYTTSGTTVIWAAGGQGGISYFGGASKGAVAYNVGSINGGAALSYGCGGGGGGVCNTVASSTGGDGADGICIVTEFIS